MTADQQKLVEDNHGLIFCFLDNGNLPRDEFYDLAAIGLCKAAIAYNGKWKFSTIAYKCMSHEIGHDFTKKNAKKRTVKGKLIYLDSLITSETNASFEKIICGDACTEETAISNVQADKTLNSLSKSERKIVNMLLTGYTQAEIAEEFKLSQAEISRRKIKISEKLRSDFYE